jgi:hypothetical protein
MTAALLQARERIVRPREQLIDRRLQRFAWRHREAVTALTRRHPRLADLALSFPALLFALAVPRSRFRPEPAIERVIAGAPLSELAAAADLPMWTRKLMPEAFLHAIPTLPDGEIFRRQIANHLPSSPKHAYSWLKAVSTIAQWGHDDLAIWYTRRIGNRDEEWKTRNWQLICLWAWHSGRPDAFASLAVGSRWSPDMSAAQALEAANDFAESIQVFMWLGDKPIADPWAEPSIIDGYSFEPVTTARELITHASALRNCSREYARSIAQNGSRIWVVKRDGKLQAMLSLCPSSWSGRAAIGQLKGPSNEMAPAALCEASTRWVMLHASTRQIEPSRLTRYPLPHWQKLWRTYWLDKRRIPAWLPLTPAAGAWRDIVHGLC